MQFNLQLGGLLDAASAASIADTLRAIGGVEAVHAVAGTNRVTVAFDVDRTSAQEIETAATRSGFPVRGGGHAHGGCCGSGSCGG